MGHRSYVTEIVLKICILECQLILLILDWASWFSLSMRPWYPVCETHLPAAALHEARLQGPDLLLQLLGLPLLLLHERLRQLVLALYALLVIRLFCGWEKTFYLC